MLYTYVRRFDVIGTVGKFLTTITLYVCVLSDEHKSMHVTDTTQQRESNIKLQSETKLHHHQLT